MDHGTHPSVSEHSSSFERWHGDVMMLCSYVVVVTAVRILQQMHAVTDSSGAVMKNLSCAFSLLVSHPIPPITFSVNGLRPGHIWWRKRIKVFWCLIKTLCSLKLVSLYLCYRVSCLCYFKVKHAFYKRQVR